MVQVINTYFGFRKPYNLEAQSEPTIEIVDTPITLDIDSKPAVRSQIGRFVSPSENSNIGRQASKKVSVTNTQEILFGSSGSQWTQASGPQSGHISEIFVTSEGRLYTATTTGIYSLTADATKWSLINTSVPTQNLPMPMAQHGHTLYIVSVDEVFASTDSGETWNSLRSRPQGEAIGLKVIDESKGSNSKPAIAIYLALLDRGIFRSTNARSQWELLNDGLENKIIYAIDAIQNTVFAGTNEGLYRLNADVWEQLSVDTSNAVHSLEAMKNSLYVTTGPDPFGLRSSNTNGKNIVRIVTRDTASPWNVFHSNDLGVSWTEITPKDRPSAMMAPRSIKILGTGKTLLTLDGRLSFLSNDGGQTWTSLGFDRDSVKHNIFQAVAIDKNTFYKIGAFGVYRTVNSGNSWHPFMEGIVGTRIQSLETFKDRLYVHAGSDILQSIDGGESWKSVRVDTGKNALTSTGQEHPHVNFFYGSRLTVAGGGLYGIVPNGHNLHIFRLSTDNDQFITFKEIPAFNEEALSTELATIIAEAEQVYSPDDIGKDSKLTNALQDIATFGKVGGFAVNGSTFYVEWRRHLFRWEFGNSEWENTGLIDLGKQPNEDPVYGFKLAVSGNTAYVGKRDGELFQSLDSGNTWRDVTSSLPLHYTHFKEIIFVGSTIYVATDTGALASQTGEHWRVLTDTAGQRIIIDKFVVNHDNIYGAGDTGVYNLDARGHWKQIFPDVPDKVVSLVISNGKFYIATQQRGIFHISLEAESDNKFSQK